MPANISDTTFDQKSSEPPDVGVLNCQGQTDKQTDIQCASMTESASGGFSENVSPTLIFTNIFACILSWCNDYALSLWYQVRRLHNNEINSRLIWKAKRGQEDLNFFFWNLHQNICLYMQIIKFHYTDYLRSL